MTMIIATKKMLRPIPILTLMLRDCAEPMIAGVLLPELADVLDPEGLGSPIDDEWIAIVPATLDVPLGSGALGI